MDCVYIGTQCFITLFNSSGLKLWGFLIGFPFSPIIKKLLPDSKERCDADLSTITASVTSKVVKLSSNPSGLSSPTLLLFSVATTADFGVEDSAVIMLPKASSFTLSSASPPLVWFCCKNFKY